jgi:DNA-directed RNA polymerase subunit F
MSLLATDQIKYQYLYFAANVVAKSDIQGLDPVYFFNITKELMINHKRYIEYLHKLQLWHDEKNMEIVDKLNKYRKEKQSYSNHN